MALGLYHGMFWGLYHTIFLLSSIPYSLPLLHSYHFLYLTHYHCFLPLIHSLPHLIFNIVPFFVSPNHFYLSSFSPFFIIIINHPLIHSIIHNITSFVFWGVVVSFGLFSLYNIYSGFSLIHSYIGLWRLLHLPRHPRL